MFHVEHSKCMSVMLSFLCQLKLLYLCMSNTQWHICDGGLSDVALEVFCSIFLLQLWTAS